MGKYFHLELSECALWIPAALFVLSILLIFTAAPSFAQLGTATLSGVITDSSGAVIPNAEVVLEGTQQAFTRTTKTSSDGTYVLASLQPGSYVLTVHAAGFQDQRSTGIGLASGQQVTLNLNLTVAGASTQVMVQAGAPLMQTTSASLGTTIGSTQVSKLPILGGSFLNVLDIAPATIPYAPPGTTYNYSPFGSSGNVMPSVFGQRQKDNDFLVDGVENRDPDFLGVSVYPPPESIAEMRVDSGVGSAIYGHGSGATVNIVTKSGTNQWHGGGWEYFRNNVLNARSYFLSSVGELHWNQFGGYISGPLEIPHLLSKNKRWYIFAYYEGVRINSASNYTTLVPTPANLTGNFAGAAPIYDPSTTTSGPGGAQVRTQYPGNIIPPSELNPTSVALAKALFPAPNLPVGQIPGVNYINTGGISKQNGNQWSGRVDHQFGQHDNFFVRYTGASNPSKTIGLPTNPATTTVTVANVVISDTHIISPTFLVTGRYGLMLNFYNPNTPGPPGLAAQSGIGDTFGFALGGPMMPSLSIPGYASPGFGQSKIYSLENSWTGDAQKTAGEHTIEFGGGIIHIHIHDASTTAPTITFESTQTSDFTSKTGNTFASFLLGVPFSANRTLGVDDDADGTLNSNVYSAYLQDTWRHRKLTADLGLRYDFASVPVDGDGMGTFDFSTGKYVWDKTNPITGAPPNIPRGGTPPDYDTLAPRVGLAYAITPRTVARASFGLFYDIFGSQYIQGPQGTFGSYPFSFPQSVTGLNPGVPTAFLPNPFPPTTTPAAECTQCLNLEKSSTRTPYVQEWTLSLQQQLGENWAIEADYFGSHGVKLPGQIVDNTAVVPGPGPITARQVYPQLPPYILNNFNVFPSWYEAASLQLRRNFARGLQFMANYTFSKDLNIMDNISDGGLGGQPTVNPTRFNYKSFKGPAGYDAPQVLVMSGVWNIPGHTGNRLLDGFVAGWTVSGISNFRSGVPFMLVLTTDNENIGTVSGRVNEFPNIVGNPHAIKRSVQEWFNTAAFAVPPPYTAGNFGRNLLRTGGFISTDGALSKNWKIKESRSVEFRGEFFNLFNHANFGYPGNQVGTAQFGTVSNVINPGREIQLDVHLNF